MSQTVLKVLETDRHHLTFQIKCWEEAVRRCTSKLRLAGRPSRSFAAEGGVGSPSPEGGVIWSAGGPGISAGGPGSSWANSMASSLEMVVFCSLTAVGRWVFWQRRLSCMRGDIYSVVDAVSSFVLSLSCSLPSLRSSGSSGIPSSLGISSDHK